MNSKYFMGGVLVVALGMTAVSASAKGGDHMGKMRGPQMTFEQLDTDRDGFITQAEIDAQFQLRFDGMDANDDDAISLEELQAFAKQKEAKRAERKLGKMFERMDANDDGKLTADEMKPKGDRAGKMLERLDSDKDGKISKAEYDAKRAERDGKRAERRAQMFAKLDVNGDGMISEEEFAAAQDHMGKRHKKRHGDND